jgi:RHH-type proline utilization regulon transcriptional repressor/proline dehydrogenase/delta 1-pyrroline-5-carboxylate dehydrogenase
MASSSSALRSAIRAAHHRDEAEAVSLLLEAVRDFDTAAQEAASRTAAALIARVRAGRTASPVDALMREYDLSSAEGLALMELAEALLRIPDAATRDMLIRDKIGDADWQNHAGGSKSRLVNLATFGLEVSARVIGPTSALGRLVGRVGTPVIRGAVSQTIKHLGDRFVYAETIAEAVRSAGFETRLTPLARHSFDMLGEAARTYDDAAHYLAAYSDAIATIAAASPPGSVIERPGISVKISALHPRYELAQKARLQAELLPGLVNLARQAAQAGISFTVDAEEAERLDLSLDIFEHLALEPSLAGWNGLGLAIQAYSKRALPAIAWVEDLARRSQRRIMVRLVKGAYWDSEIKRAQQEGLADYPVFTRKETTDLSYLACALRLLKARAEIYPMFATHNAFTLAAIHEMAGAHTDYEFQRLHGMGEALQAATASWKIPCRVYAPVGPYRDLLAYLVRRLLENGANSSFVNKISDPQIAIEALAQSPVSAIGSLDLAVRNPRIGMPTALYEGRHGAPGIDFGDPQALETLQAEIFISPVEAAPLIGGDFSQGDAYAIISPAASSVHVGSVIEASEDDANRAVKIAQASYPAWSALPVGQRSSILHRAADLLARQQGTFVSLLVYEAGRTIRNAIGEWREAIDFLRYYANDAERLMQSRDLPGPTGESNRLGYAGKGVFACISPWNFPLSIFIGQVAAALATGNAVIAKPAGETPLIAFEAVRLLHEAGVPKDILHYLPGGAAIGAALVAQPDIIGVVFTGSTATAKKIAQSLAAKDGPLATLIAETGGQNAMIVDSSALLEQVVSDAIASAFDSAGQRCSALRILAVQDDIADRLIALLRGAMATLTIGDPADLSSDIGPIIHAAARDRLNQHLVDVTAYGKILAEVPVTDLPWTGSFFAPRLIEIDRIDRLTQEVFGPILHIVRWKAGTLLDVIAQINALGYGLTLGLQTRIGATVALVEKLARVGNLYVNRSQIGAVVETQPFGGENLSGTGPKAGGPHYLTRFVTERVVTINTAASGGNAELLRGD